MRIRDIISQHKSIETFEALNLVAAVLSTKKESVMLNLDRDVDEKTYLNIERFLAEREKGMPFAYIVKNKEFFSEEFFVNEKVLIPRPETELLVEEALTLIKRNKTINNLLDMGTGSGVIGLILAKKTQKHVVCADISLEALRVAKRNGEKLGVSKLTRFVCSDLFSGICGAKFDMILANLPYIGTEEMDYLMVEVKNYEPRMALDGGIGGIQIYERFIEGLPRYLKDTGYVVCEIGGHEQAIKLYEMFKAIGLTTTVKKDLSGHERVIIGSWTSLS